MGMLYSKIRSLDERITELLLKSPLQVKTLHGNLCYEDKTLSLRAVYKVVQQLIEAGVVIKAGKMVRIDEEWLRNIQTKLISSATLNFFPGERMSYSFASISHLDSFWKTIVFQLEKLEKDGQVFFYNPHNFWAYLPERRESEDAYYKHFFESRLHAFFTVGGNTFADKEFKRKYQNEYLQINTVFAPVLGREHHITIVGDYVINVRIGKKAALQIDEQYITEGSITELLPNLAVILGSSFTSRFTLEHNRLKAAKLRKVLSRGFYLGSKTVR